MIKRLSTFVLFGAALSTAGCMDLLSLHALHTPQDRLFDSAIEGRWRADNRRLTIERVSEADLDGGFMQAVLTMGTAELRQVVTKFANEPRAFDSDEVVFERAPADSAPLVRSIGRSDIPLRSGNSLFVKSVGGGPEQHVPGPASLRAPHFSQGTIRDVPRN